MKEEKPQQVISTIGGSEPPSYIQTYADFNSTTKLADDYPEVYNPFEHRRHDSPTSTGGALAHLLKSSLGTGILAMPLAFSNAGLLFGGLATIIVGLACLLCVHQLVAVSHKLCRIAKVPVLGFAETAEKVFEYGPERTRKYAKLAKEFVDYSLLLTYYATCCVYIVFIASTFHDICNSWLNLNWTIRIYILLVGIPALFIGQVQSLKWLVPFSAVANVFILITFGITLYYMFNVPLDFSDKALVANVVNWPMFFSTVIFAMEGIGVVMPVENSMKHPHHFLGCAPGILNIAMISIISLYTIIGFFGFVRFGYDIKGSITLNLDPMEPAALTAQILIGLAILFTFGLQFFIPTDITMKKLSNRIPKDKRTLYESIIRAVVTLVLVGVATAVPDLEPFIGLTGAVFLSTLGIFMPAFLQMVYQCTSGFGYMKWKLIKNVILMVFSILAMVTGAFTSIREIIKLYTGDEE
jgi:proton-coupled amino acid transporter